MPKAKVGDPMKYRKEHDSLGEMLVPADRMWGAQTQRSLENFPIGDDIMPREITRAFAVLKKAAAIANRDYGKLDDERCTVIGVVCDAVLSGKLYSEFPLSVWQTGSGTQSNMNMNEVVASIGNRIAGKELLHPNDHVNMSQSSNDTFPTAMHIAAVTTVTDTLIPAASSLISTLKKLEEENSSIIKIGRTHLQDATPVRFSQEISGWRSSLEHSLSYIETSLSGLYELALGGTAVGTGLNAPEGFDAKVAEVIAELTDKPFASDSNKFHSLTSKDAIVFSHGAIKALACDYMKMANDIRWLASGPRCGFGEITIPENEPGSSIMPGKVNPTQCESATMVAVQVMGNDATIGIAASQGNFELNVFMPVIINNYLHSVRLLADSMNSFNERCVSGIKAVPERMETLLNESLMLVTCLSPVIGYENAAKAARLAHEEGLLLKEAVLKLGLMTEEEYDRQVDPSKMV